MKYVSLSGLRKYMGDDYDSWEEQHADAERELERCEMRLLAYIIPNSPACDEQVQAFASAVYAQIQHEAINGTGSSEIPEGVASFSVNGFSATMKQQTGDSVSEAGISRAAKAYLLHAGLLYRGVSVC